MSANPENSSHDSAALEKKLAAEHRLCHMMKRPDFDGYGFNLHSEKGKPGQYIGKVDEKSPAEQAGLRQGDRIIEVNGVNIGSETHKQVVQRIKAIENEVRLLVVDPDVETRVKQQHQKEQQEHQVSNKAPGSPTAMNNNNNSTNSKTPSPTSFSSKQQQQEVISNRPSLELSSNGQDVMTTGTTTPSPSPSPNLSSGKSSIQNGNMNGSNGAVKTSMPSTDATGGSSSTSSSSTAAGLNLKMTAAEMRAKLQARKKYDPKNDTVDLRKKFDIIQKL